MDEIRITKTGNPNSIAQMPETKWMEFKDQQLELADYMEGEIIELEKQFKNKTLRTPDGQLVSEDYFQVLKRVMSNFVLRRRGMMDFFEDIRLSSK